MPELEKALQKAVKNGQAIEHVQVAKSELADAFKDDPYKQELLANYGETVDATSLATSLTLALTHFCQTLARSRSSSFCQ